MRPDLRPDLPVYPVHTQLIRVTSTTVSGPTGVTQVVGSSVLAPRLYIAYVQQHLPDSLLPRDREPCLVNDVTGMGASPGFYLGRLSSQWTGLPVYTIIPILGGLSGIASDGSLINNINWNNLLVNISSLVFNFLANTSNYFNLNTNTYLFINGPGFLVVNAGFKIRGGLWLDYKTKFLGDEETALDPGPADTLKPVLRLGPPAGGCDLHGMIPYPDSGAGLLLKLENIGPAGEIVIFHDSAGADEDRYRFYCPGNDDFTLVRNAGVWVWYDPNSERYRVNDASSGGDGGGGNNGPTELFGQDQNTSLYSITTDDTWEDTGVEVTIPVAGTYKITATATGMANATDDGSPSSGFGIEIRLYNSTDAAQVSNTVTSLVSVPTLNTNELDGEDNVDVSTIDLLLLITGAKTIKLQARRSSDVSWLISDVLPPARLNFVRISSSTAAISATPPAP